MIDYDAKALEWLLSAMGGRAACAPRLAALLRAVALEAGQAVERAHHEHVDRPLDGECDSCDGTRSWECGACAGTGVASAAAVLGLEAP